MKYLVLDYFEQTVQQHPQKIAFSDINKSITFADLEASAQSVASAILNLNKKIEVVAFYTDKSVDTVVGFGGAIYAGCAYTQINLRNPASRISEILNTITPCVVVTDKEHISAWQELGLDIEALLIEDLIETPIDFPKLLATRETMLDITPLYINFTSGSTGKPKGVSVCHRSVIDFITCFTEIFHITADDIIANQAPFDFDVSVKDIYSGLFTGATVQIVPTSYFINPVALMDFLCERQATVMIWAVSALCFITSMNGLDYRVPDKLRTIMFSGEVMPIKHLKKLQKYLPDVQYVNLYGPTEITCNCSYYIVDREFELTESLPIGKPFPNEKLILLDEEDREVSEMGEVGELCVSGTALALGYYRNREKTNEVFIQNPNNHDYNELIYRTGDLVRIGEDGELYYLTRKDFQVKHMGHRVELGEIEVCLQSADGVDRACCVFDEKKDKIIAIYTGTADKSELVKQLETELPQFMIPQNFYLIETFPLNKNGKIDRNKLKEEYISKRVKK